VAGGRDGLEGRLGALVSHKGHPVCEYSSKAACEKARRITIGQCRAMLDEDRQCPNWGIDTLDGRGYCGQHLPGLFRAADEARRLAAIRDAMNERIDAFMVKTGQTPHVCGDHCVFSQV
jgi:hypothetical protein